MELLVQYLSMGKNKKAGNVNEPGHSVEERPYYDDRSEKEEQEKLPVEYLGYLEKRKESRTIHFFIWTIVLFLVIVVAPGTLGKEYDARTGEYRSVRKFTWGRWEYTGRVHSTEWTDWYYKPNPRPVNQRWLPFDKTSPSIFGVIAIPIKVTNYRWEMPENLMDRMRELETEIHGGRGRDIPETLHKVNSGLEWNAIIVPLTQGTVKDAKNWWDEHKTDLMDWAEKPEGTPLPQSYIDDANAYIESFKVPEGNVIPLVK